MTARDRYALCTPNCTVDCGACKGSPPAETPDGGPMTGTWGTEPSDPRGDIKAAIEALVRDAAAGYGYDPRLTTDLAGIPVETDETVDPDVAELRDALTGATVATIRTRPWAETEQDELERILEPTTAQRVIRAVVDAEDERLAAEHLAHSPCCSAHGEDMTCEKYRRTHFVEVRPCCAFDAAVLKREGVTGRVPARTPEQIEADDIAATLNRARIAYARRRRDTPTGTIIGRVDPIRERAAWLELRRTGIGSSDVPVLLGLSKGTYARSELDLYMDKRGETPDDESGEAALWGTIFEDPVAREWARRQTEALGVPVTVQRVGTIAHVDHRHMLCDLDRRVIGCPDHDRCALEVKTRSAFKADEWRDGVPEDTEAQVMHQLAVTGFDAIHVAAVIGGQRLVSYVVEPDADFIADLVAIEHEFWTGNVLAGVPPMISSLELLVDHLKHFTPTKGTVVEVTGADALEARALAAEYDTLKASGERLDEVENRLKALIGEDGSDLTAVDEDGTEHPLFTWRSQAKPKQLDKTRVEALLGAPLDSFKVPTGTTRVLRRIKPKEAKK